MMSVAGRVVAVLALSLYAAAPAAGAPAAAVVLMRIDGAIGPAAADYLHRGLAFAAARRAQLAVLQLDTPGGLDASMRGIVKDILASPVPVATFVAPDGARAASAGTYILYASHVAAMATASNLGAATPVAIGLPLPSGQPAPAAGASGAPREPPQDALAAKRVADASAYLRSLAQLRGRNADWAERAVRDAASLSSREALELRVVDVVASDLPDLLRRLDGRRIGAAALATAGAPVVAFEPDRRDRLLAVVTDPNVALLLLLIGLAGLLFEFANPGLVLPGVVGAVSLLVALFALQTLPVDYAGLALIALGAAFLVAEAFVPSFGALGLGGIAAFVFGALLLTGGDAPGFFSSAISRPLIGLAAALFAGFVLVVARMAAKARRRPLTGGSQALLGASGEMIESADGRHGWALVGGVPWRVQGTVLPQAGRRVRVTGVGGATLDVEIDADTKEPAEGA